MRFGITALSVVLVNAGNPTLVQIIIIIIIISAKNEYLMRREKFCTHLHYSINKALGIEATDKW